MIFRRTTSSWIGLFLTITVLFCINLNPFASSAIVSPVAGSPSDDPLIILFEQAHGQFFNASIGRFSQAVADLQIDDNTIIRFCNSRLNETILSGVDILIITTPAEDTTYWAAEEETWENQ